MRVRPLPGELQLICTLLMSHRVRQYLVPGTALEYNTGCALLTERKLSLTSSEQTHLVSRVLMLHGLQLPLCCISATCSWLCVLSKLLRGLELPQNANEMKVAREEPRIALPQQCSQYQDAVACQLKGTVLARLHNST